MSEVLIVVNLPKWIIDIESKIQKAQKQQRMNTKPIIHRQITFKLQDNKDKIDFEKSQREKIYLMNT